MLIIRVIKSSDLPAALELVRSVDWNQTERDLRFFLEGEHNIFLVAEAEGRVVGTVASVHYGTELAWISMMIVAQDYRGRGISKMLLNDIIQQLKKRGYGTIKLDATPAGRPVYERLGFVEEYAIHRLVHAGWPGLDGPVPEQGIRAVTQGDMPAVIQMDKQIFGAGRSALIRRLVQDQPGFVLEAGTEILAFALCRQGRKFHQIGPVGGVDADSVRVLIKTLLQELKGKAVAVDIIAGKEQVESWLEDLGFEYQRPFYRMFLNSNNAPGQIAHHYLIAGPEFG